MNSEEMYLPYRASRHHIRAHQAPIRSNQKKSEAIRGHQRASEGIRGHQRASEAIRAEDVPAQQAVRIGKELLRIISVLA
jgi:hypothetical protein